jgi:hypothetical protein
MSIKHFGRISGDFNRTRFFPKSLKERPKSVLFRMRKEKGEDPGVFNGTEKFSHEGSENTWTLPRE